MMTGKLLIIDDDGDFRDAVSTMLTSKGFEVLTAPNGKEGFAIAQKQMPDLILLDVMMTHKTEGFDTARIFKDDEKTKNIPVVMVTGIKNDMHLAYDFKPDEEWLPVKAVIEKPVNPEALLKIIEENIKK
ncbi:MAG: response regulator [Candidatus Omnitrophota bacterium]